MGGLNLKKYEMALSYDCSGSYYDNGRVIGLGRIDGPEAIEVMPPFQPLRRRGHRFDVQFLFDPPHMLLRKGGTARGDLVQIGAGNGIVAGMKFIGRLIHIQDDDLWRQAHVQLALQFRGAKFFDFRAGCKDT